jgi:hypothetical protein
LTRIKEEWYIDVMGNAAFQTAVALAEYRFADKKDKEQGETAVLEQVDFEQVCAMSEAFKKYLGTLHGLDETGRAQMERTRLDSYEE